MKNKNAISPVVATILMVLITIAAVTIIWAAIIPMVKDQLTGGTSCLDATMEISVDATSGYTCVNDTASAGKTDVFVQVTRGPKDFDLAGLQFIVYGADGNTVSVENTTILAMPGANEARVFVFNVTNTTTYTKVDVAPIVQTGNTADTCGTAASVALNPC